MPILMRGRPIYLISQVLALTAFTGPQPANAAECRFAGLVYSEGATVCECPRLFSRGQENTILQYRLICGGDGRWGKMRSDDPDNRDTCMAVVNLDSRGDAVALFQTLAPSTCQVNSGQ